MHKLYSAANLQEAYLVLHRLQHANIDARIFNEHAHGALGEIPFTHAYPEVWIIEDADLARARAVVEEFQRAPAAGGARTCRFCGEANPAGFELCWRCGGIFQ